MNSMTMKKFQSTALSTVADVASRIIALEGKLGKLRARRDDVTKQMLSLEKVSVGRGTADADVAQAQAMLDGVPFVATPYRAISQLAALHAERDLIDSALKIGEAQLHRLVTERADQIWSDHFAEIAAIEKKRVLVMLELQRINRARETLREKIRMLGGAGFLSTDGPEFLGLGDRREEVHWACERLIADGISSRAEIERAASDA